MGQVIPQIDPAKTKNDALKEKKKATDAKPTQFDKVVPKTVKPGLKKKPSPSKRMVKPVEIHSQGLLASNTTVKATKKEEAKFLSLRQLTTQFFKKKVLKQKEEENNPDKIDLWELADASVKGLNRV